MEIRYAKAAIKVIGGLDRSTKQRIKNAVERLPQGDVKPLSGSVRLYRLRVGDWRIVFSYPDGNTVLVERIAPRGEAYKGGIL